MNRLIKFRAWDFEKNIMLDKHDESDNSLNGVNFGLPPSFESVNTKYAWMQFTGLHDKNGKEIYEGDILKHQKATEPEDKGWIIEYVPCQFIAKLITIIPGEGFTLSAFNAYFEKCEVIGNIYENPELLTL